MDDAREKFVHFMWDRSAIRVDDGPSSWSPHIYESLIDTAYYILCSYIRKERDDDKEFGMGRLERSYLCTDEFMIAADAHRWIDENRESTDMGLIIHIYDNVYNMTPGKHRRALLYTLNMLYFDL